VFSRALHRTRGAQRAGYVYNVGLDFGTAFTKCVIRDVANATAWPLRVGSPLSFLIPSEIRIAKGAITGPLDPKFAGAPVSYLKMALAATAEPAAKEAWKRTVHDRIEDALGSATDEHFQALTVYYLAQVLSAARRFILSQKRDFSEHPDDICFVNLALPVAHAESRRLQAVFLTALQYARHFAFGGGLGPCEVNRLLELVRTARIPTSNDEHCYLYPEVSANVQSYIRSPAAQEKLHLFVDVGAGTVDLSVLIWNPAKKHDRPLS
jgi:hypothetical protein